MSEDVQKTRSGQIRWHSSCIVSNYKLDATKPGGKTALMQAVELLQESNMAKRLILSAAYINYIDKNNWNALHYASWKGFREIVESILNNNIKRNKLDIDARTRNGQTALSLATYEGHEDIARLLLEYGADINLKADTNRTRIFHCTWTLLHHASCRGWIRIVQAIFDKSDLDAKTQEGMTALVLAAKMGHQHIAEVLLLSGAGVGGVDEDKWTVLHHAACKGWLSVVAMILERQPNLEDKTYHGETALILSAINGHREVVELLLEYGASLDCRDRNQWPLLHYVSCLGWTEIVKLVVLDGRCDINEKVPWTRPKLLAYCIHDEKTALMVAVEHEEKEVAEVLIKHGAYVHELKHSYGISELTRAILWSSVNWISLLVENGAYFTIFDYKRICDDFVLREQVLKDRDICTRAVVNEYNVACLPALKELSGSYNIVLPSIENLNINGGNALREIEKTVDREIETKGICNVIEVRPLVLQMMAVRSLLDYHYCQRLFYK